MAKKSVTMQELIGRKEELNKTSQLLSEKFQNLQNEVSTTEKQIHMVNGALNVLDPTVFLPAAGPAIFPFLEESLSLGKGNIFVHQNFLNSNLIE